MKGITKKQVKEDLVVIDEMCNRYINAIYGETDFKPSDLEQQFKHVRIAIPTITGFLKALREHLSRLADDNMPIIEDEIEINK